MSKEARYPRFIQNKPCGVDKFDGQSHRRLTEAIKNHILSTDSDANGNSLSRIIGLEGGWGIGKSNVIKQLKEFLKGKYWLFEYDAWGHQEDLQRRSFLELLTDRLINEAGILEKEEWDKKLKELLARKVIRVNKTLPKFNPGTLVMAFLLSLTPITVFLAERLEVAQKVTCILYLILIAFAPILLGIFLWLIFRVKYKEMRSLSYFLQISKDENVETKNYETINEDEPTVVKFKKWMQDISDYIKENEKQKIVIVFDNMDRLPAEKVKELWSSIHTFFSEDGFENIWVIIPFDEKHLSSAFGENDAGVQLTKYFITKSFPLVYRVTPPVITDFKKLFNDLYEEAFAKTEAENQKEINRIFRLKNPKATVRDIIIFIKHLVALKTIWKNEIDILSMAIFTLTKDVLLEDAVKKILSGDYLDDSIRKLVQNNEFLQKNMSALSYGISPDDAEQIPISRYIESCFKMEKEYDINKYMTHKHFLSVLEDNINDTDIPIDILISVLSQLDTQFENDNKDIISRLWDNIAKRKMQVPLEEQAFDNLYQNLLIHSSKIYQQTVANFLCDKFQKFDPFAGDLYYHALNDLNKAIIENKLEIHIDDYIEYIDKSPETYFSYLSVAEADYTKYKIKTNPDEFDSYLANLVPDKLLSAKIFSLLKSDKIYHFEKTLQKIQETIKEDTQGLLVNEKNFKAILDVYKVLCNEKPFSTELNINQRTKIWNAYATKKNTDEYLEIVTIQLANSVSISDTFDDQQIETIAKNIEYYTDYGDLLENCVKLNIPILNQVTNYLTKHSVGRSRMAIKDILPLFEQIKTKIGVNESELLGRLNNWNEFAKKITKEEIQTVIPSSQFFMYSIVTKNELTDHLNKIALDALFSIPVDEIYNYRKEANNYWMKVIAYFIDTDYMKSLPYNLTEFGKKLIDDIAAGKETIPNPDDLLQKIIDILDKKMTSAHIKDIRDKFCNGKYTMNAQLFIYFEPWFELQGDLSSRSADVVHKIVEPVIDDPDCLKIIISKSGYYVKIINKAGDDSTGIRSKLKEKLQTSEDSEFIAFAKKIVRE